MIDATLFVHGEGERHDWGQWSFAALPLPGNKISVRAADGTLVYMRVRDVEHQPVRSGTDGATAIVTCDWEAEDLLDAETEALLE
jgi:hypothetical protein